MPKIAIVEDDTAIQLMYKMKLEREGFKVQIAANGIEGLKVAEEFRPDLILLDLRMPIMDGAEMLEKMRATSWGSKMHVIILTNISKSEAPQNLRLLNVERYIVKAYYTPTQVMAIIREVLNFNPLPS
jgi:DNA-binding response OmpR family regulator